MAPSAPESDRPDGGALATRPAYGPRGRVRYNAALKVVRRVHMYAGLFLAPWVLLYGVSAFLFNHPTAFPDRPVLRCGPEALAGTGLDDFPTAAELAPRVVDALNGGAGGPSYRLVDAASAAYSRRLFVTATGGGREHSVLIDPDAKTLLIRSGPPARPDASAELDRRTLLLDDAPADRWARGVPVALGRLGLPAEALAVRNPPDLICAAESGGRRVRVAYNLATGLTTVRPDDGPAGRLSTRAFLTGLHLAFGYPSVVDARWAWALIVDVMAGAMVVWGLTGLAMWWQMRSQRRRGLAALALSLAAAAALGLAMYDRLGR